MPQRAQPFRIIYMGNKSLPAAADTCDERPLTYLHGLYNSHSFGHVVRDNFQAITWTLMNLGLDAEPFRLRVLERHKRNAGMPRVVRKYAAWIAVDVDTWANQLAGCAHTYILFRRFVAGYGGIIYERPPRGCFAANFLQQREAAYRAGGLELLPAHRLPRVRVLFGDKSHADSRRITNIMDLLPVLRERFPQAEFAVKMLSSMSETDQLRALRKTSVFISPVGSSSFRLIYLPTGAHVILVGAPEFDAAGNSLVPVFSEVTECWKNLPHFTFSSYHVTQANESITRFERLMHGWRPERPELIEQFRIWDADTVLNADKLGGLVRDALDALQRDRREGDPLA